MLRLWVQIFWIRSDMKFAKTYPLRCKNKETPKFNSGVHFTDERAYLQNGQNHVGVVWDPLIFESPENCATLFLSEIKNPKRSVQQFLGPRVSLLHLTN